MINPAIIVLQNRISYLQDNLKRYQTNGMASTAMEERYAEEILKLENAISSLISTNK